MRKYALQFKLIISHNEQNHKRNVIQKSHILDLVDNLLEFRNQIKSNQSLVSFNIGHKSMRLIFQSE